MGVQILSLFHIKLIFQNVAYIYIYMYFLIQNSGIRPISHHVITVLNSSSSLYTHHKPKGMNLCLELSGLPTHCKKALAEGMESLEERDFVSTFFFQTHQSGSWMRG